MARARRVCPTNGCPQLTEGGRCSDCKANAERLRGTANQRGYGHEHTTRFRDGVLLKDPECVCVDDGHGHDGRCSAPSTRADHYPRSRRELVRAGVDPDDPRYGRGLCARCDSSQTARRQPGGWNAR